MNSNLVSEISIKLGGKLSLLLFSLSETFGMC